MMTETAAMVAEIGGGMMMIVAREETLRANLGVTGSSEAARVRCRAARTIATVEATTEMMGGTVDVGIVMAAAAAWS
jgi:hypothetical protein